jgi:hypothetical protein
VATTIMNRSPAAWPDVSIRPATIAATDTAKTGANTEAALTDAAARARAEEPCRGRGGDNRVTGSDGVMGWILPAGRFPPG